MRIWICKLCGHFNPPDDRQCYGCGIDRSREPAFRETELRSNDG